MGSGKTTVGRIVADALGCVFLDLDQVVESRLGCSIAEYFRTSGEEAFRREEEKSLADVVKKYAQGDLVLALGGGSVLSARSRKLLHENTTCIWLQAPAEELLQRIISTNTPAQSAPGSQAAVPVRPLFDENFASRLASRLPLYEQVSHVTIDTSGLSPQDIADEIIISCL